jgi:hypothetical protein
MSVRGYMGNTFHSIPGAVAHGLSLSGDDYSFMPYCKAGKMLIVRDHRADGSTFGSIDIVTVAEARTRYAALVAQGAAKTEARRTAYGCDYYGGPTFDAKEIVRVPDTDMFVVSERSKLADKLAGRVYTGPTIG